MSLILRQTPTKLIKYLTKSNNYHVVKRSVCSTDSLKDIFTVQDTKDFNERVLKSKQAVIVDFHATWCGPCKMLGPRLETIVGGKANQVHLAKVDVDENEELAVKFEVSSVPAVFGIKDGKIIDQFIGLKDEDQLKAFVDKLTGA